jgi:hypothetical protein
MNSKLLALGAQKRFQGERERERRTNHISRSQIGSSDVASLALSGPCFSCLLSLGHAWFCIEPDSMVLCVFFILQNNLVNVLLCHHLFYFLQQPSEIEF